MTGAPFRTVLVGLGRVGAGYAEDPLMAKSIRYATHAQVLADHPAFDWGAVVDVSMRARERAAARWDVPLAADSPERVADEYRPEVAVLATPPEARIGLLERLPGLSAVVVEKPLGRSLAEAEEFLALCVERSILVQVNLWRRADERFRALADGDLEARIGRPQAIFALYGNGLTNNGTHVVDFLRMLAGDFELVQAVSSGGQRSSGPIAGDPDLAFTAHLADGATAAVLPVDFRHYREVGLDVWGERGRLSILQEGLSIRSYPRAANRSASDECEIASDRPAEIESTIGYAFFRLYSNLAEVLDGGAELWSPGVSALRSERVTHAVRHSAEQGGVPVECSS